MTGWWHKHVTPIGLDIGSARVRLIQLEKKGQGWSALAAASCALPAELPQQGEVRTAVLTSLIKPMLAAQPFRGRKVVSSLPTQALMYKNLRMPRMPGDELKAAIEWEASDRLHMPVDSMSIQYIDAGEVRQGDELRHEIILLAAPDTVIHEHVSLLQVCDLVPVAIDATPGAMARCLTACQPSAGDAPAGVMLDVGYESSRIVMVRDGQVVFFKVIDIGGRHLDQVVSQQLNLSLADARDLRFTPMEQMESHGVEEGDQALFGGSKRESVSRAVYEAQRTLGSELAREVGLCLRYYSVTFRGRRPEEMQVVGGESCDDHLLHILSQNVEMKVSPGYLTSQLDVSHVPELMERKGRLGAWATAAGLALRHEEAAAMRGAA